MTPLESIVLPLAESRALVEHGIVLKTVLCWYIAKPDGAHEDCVWVKTPGSQDDEVPAPTLGELLDAIRAKVYPIMLGIDGLFWTVKWIEPTNPVPLRECWSSRTSDLLAAAALLMGVSK